jgi:hypothetical protein
MWQNMRAYRTVANNPCPHINAELLLMYSSCYNSQIKCYRTHADMDVFSCFGVWNSCPKFGRTLQKQCIVKPDDSCMKLQILYEICLFAHSYKHLSNKFFDDDEEIDDGNNNNNNNNNND